MKDVQDGGDAVVEPDAKDSPTDVAADNAGEIKGDAQKKGAKPFEKGGKMKEEVEEEDSAEEISENLKTKMII